MTPPHRVLIIGGGFGGLQAAKALRRAPVEVTLVDRANHHLFQPLLYQVATGVLGEGEIAPRLRDVLAGQDNARVVLADVHAFDLDAGTVDATAPDGEPLTLAYDSLIVAAGATGGMKSLDDARAVRLKILRAVEMAEQSGDPAWLQFAVVGAGATGVELAGRLAELGEVSLLEAGPRVLPDLPEKLGRRAEQDLAELGVDVWLRARVDAFDDTGVEVETAAGMSVRFPARTVTWAGGVKASPLAEALGAETDDGGRVLVTDALTLPGRDDVHVIGDMAALDGVPGIAPAAMQQGRHAARQIRRRIAGRPARPFRYADKGRLAVIGRGRAVGTAYGVRLTGRDAMLVWAVVHLWYLVGWENRLVTAVRWLLTRRLVAPAPLTELSKPAPTTRVTI